MKTLKTLAVALLVLSMSACDSFFDINTDPDAATQVPGGLLFPTMLANWGSNRAMEGGQYTNYWSQTYSSNGQLANWTQAENYQISSTAVNNHWLAYYGSVQRNAALGIESALSATPARNNEAAQFLILSAMNYYEASLLWENVPFSQANQPVEFPTPVFDTQQEVFNGVIAQLDRAIGLIDPANTATTVGARDVVYNSNMENWRRLANAAKLHVYMSLRGGGQNVDAEIQALINLPNDQMLRSAAQNAYIPFNEESKNPLGRMQEVYAPTTGRWFWSGKPVTDIMNERNDPRRPIYMMPNRDGEFRNAAAGSAIDPIPLPTPTGATPLTAPSNASRTRLDTYLSNSAPVLLMAAHEVLFLEAEWLADNGQLGPADDKFREGVRQAFASLPRRANAAAPSAAQLDAFLAQFPALATVGQEEALRLIWRQHYVGLHGDGIQSWTLVRRVGEPVFGLSFPPSPAGGLTSWISRWPYQVNEVAANPNAPQENPPLDRNMWFQGRAQQ